jgi:hypothetical protein
MGACGVHADAIVQPCILDEFARDTLCGGRTTNVSHTHEQYACAVLMHQDGWRPDLYFCKKIEHFMTSQETLSRPCIVDGISARSLLTIKSGRLWIFLNCKPM